MGMDQKIEKKTSPWRFLLYGLVGLGFVYLLFRLYQESGTSKLIIDQERILIDTIETSIFKEYISIFGTVEPLKTVYIDAIERGRVEEVYVEDGTMVEANTPILRLSNLDLQLEVLNQEAQIVDQINTIRYQGIIREQQSLALREQALDVEFRIDLFEKRVKRNSQLIRDSIIAQVDFDEAQDEYEHLLRRRKLLKATIEKDSLSQVIQQDQMETSLDLMRRNLAFAKNSLDNLIIRAPIKGQLSSLDREVGELINQGNRIAQVDVLDDFKILARINEFYISRIYPQQAGTITINNQTYNLSIKKIYPEVQNSTFEVDLVFDGERPRNIRRGQSVTVKLSLSDETKAKLLKKGGFFKDTGGKWVYKIGTDGNARKQDIILGRHNPDYYEVQGGLSDGDVVIVSSYKTYGDKDELVIN